MKNTAIYPGTFDPVTFGHIDVMKRASKLFDTIIVAVAEDTPKQTFFTSEERVNFIKEAIKKEPLENISVESFSGLAVNFAKRKQAS